MTDQPTTGSTPPCSPEATMCGGTPDDCWNHAAVNGHCYRGVAYVDRLLIALEAHGETVKATVDAAVQAERDRCTAIIGKEQAAFFEQARMADDNGDERTRDWSNAIVKSCKRLAAGIESGEPA